LVVLYFVLVLPVANAEVPPANFRFPFSFITLIYAADLTILGVDFIYKLARPPKTPAPAGKIGWSGVLGMILRTAFMLSVGGSYVTGAAIATPTVFQPIMNAPLPLGTTLTYTAGYLHSWFATLIIAFGAAVVVFEIAKLAAHKQSLKDWLGFSGRYPEIKWFYWALAVCVIVQGVLGVFLLGTISPYGPYGLFGLLGSQSYSFEHLIRQLHGPIGALTFALFTNHIYLRIRPEWHVK
jgi:hypothetical protein